jgi:hypothetical protein
VHDDRGTTTISNDGATIMKLLDIVHPAAKSLVDIAKSQDSEVGDGTTTVVILAGEFLRECKPFVEDGVHPQNIIKHFREAAQMAIARVKSLSGEFIYLFLFANGVLYFRTGNLTDVVFFFTHSVHRGQGRRREARAVEEVRHDHAVVQARRRREGVLRADVRRRGDAPGPGPAGPEDDRSQEGDGR